jgi:uncharacterized protein YdhG (YjbR/CyaY superfamily)
MAGSESVDGYLAALPDRFRVALEDLRGTIRAVVPDATETISYQIPTFRYRGRALVSYAAFREHCSLFPMSIGIIDAHGDEVAPYRSGRGTLRFTPDAPLPADLVRRIVLARIEENAAKQR